jgi:phosphopantothenoylcysteine synthetase/decarboxylase
MKVLVTAGNTLVPIDQVRCITNIFSGRTGASIALCAHQRGHTVTLLTSRPEALAELGTSQAAKDGRWTAVPYKTVEDLQRAMSEALSTGGFDALIHSAAVNDYSAAGVYAPDSRTRFDSAEGRWTTEGPQDPTMIDRAAAKVKSDEPELWLRLVRAPKLIDAVRPKWGFAGIVVKFKLEVGVSEERLLEIAEKSRTHSQADLMVANTLEASASWAFVGPLAGAYEKVQRGKLAKRLMEAVEELGDRGARGEDKGHG